MTDHTTVDRSWDDQTFHDEIEAYCTPSSVIAGDTVALHVSTRAAFFDVVVERWGAVREVVWSEAGVAGTYTAVPGDASSHGCRWPVSLEIPVGAGWRTGFHLVTLTARGAAAGRDVAHACFVVRATPGSRRSTVLVLDTNTWNAYNTWGGRSLYTGGSRVSFARPFARGILCRPEVERDDRKSRPRRWGEQPDEDGAIFQAYRMEHAYPSAIGSAGWFTHARRFVEWAERAGHEFDMLVSTDLDEHPGILDGYELVVDVGHDEYWSRAARDAVDDHVRGGGDVVSLSGNTMFWQVRIEHDDGGVHMVCHKYRAHLDDPVVAAGDPASMTGMWADPLVGRPEWTTLGAGSAFGLYHRFGAATPRGVGGFIVYRSDHWLLAGTGLRYGDVVGADHGVVGYETVGCPIRFDELHLPAAADHPGIPEHHEVVAFVPSSNLGVGDYPSSIAALSDQGDLEFVAERLHGGTGPEQLAKVRHGNAVIVTCRPFGPDGGEVVTVGTTDWVFGLDDEAVARITSNALARR